MEEEGDCVELARSPSCVQIYFIPREASRAERVAAVVDAARTAGWETVSVESFVGGSSLRFRRSGLTAYVHVALDQRVERSREAPKDWADFVSVEPR